MQKFNRTPWQFLYNRILCLFFTATQAQKHRFEISGRAVNLFAWLVSGAAKKRCDVSVTNFMQLVSKQNSKALIESSLVVCRRTAPKCSPLFSSNRHSEVNTQKHKDDTV
jgi:hypothetical protein